MAPNDFSDYQRPRYRRGPHPLVTLGMWGVVAAVFFAGLYFGLQWLKKHDPTLLGSGSPVEKPLVRLFFLELQQRYLDDPTAANKRYTGKVVEIENKGWDKFSRVETRDGQTALLCFDIGDNNGPADSLVVLCVFPDKNVKQLAGLGKHWVIRGRVGGFDAERGVVALEDCEVMTSRDR